MDGPTWKKLSWKGSLLSILNTEINHYQEYEAEPKFHDVAVLVRPGLFQQWDTLKLGSQ